MRVTSFIERCQADVIERILRHLGLWEGPLGTLPIARGPPRAPPPAQTHLPDIEVVPDPEYLDFEYREAQTETSGELQLVFDPGFL